MIEVHLNQLNPAFEVKDQVAKSITIKKITSTQLITNPDLYRLNMLDEKDLTIYSKSFSDFNAIRDKLEWEINQEFVFYDHITIQISNEANADFDLILEMEKS